MKINIIIVLLWALTLAVPASAAQQVADQLLPRLLARDLGAIYERPPPRLADDEPPNDTLDL